MYGCSTRRTMVRRARYLRPVAGWRSNLALPIAVATTLLANHHAQVHAFLVSGAQRAHTTSQMRAPLNPICYQRSVNRPSRKCIATGSASAATQYLESRRSFSSTMMTAMSSDSSSASQRLTPTPTEKQMTQDAMQICNDAIDAVNPYSAIRSHLRVANDVLTIQQGDATSKESINLTDYSKLVLVATGKASSAMATAVTQQLEAGSPSALQKLSGVVICKDDHATQQEEELLANSNVSIQYASHPVPDVRSSQAAKAVLDLVRDTASKDTLVLCCISGGGSSLFCRPQDPLTLEDLQATNSALLASGLDIQDMNVIRKRLEEGKGGRLAGAAFPSKLVGLVLSDVLGDPLDLIASGPTVPDTSTWASAMALVEQHKLHDKLPHKVMEMLRDGDNGKLPDSPSADDAAFQTTSTVLVGNNEKAVMAAADSAKQLGYDPIVLGSQFEGEAKEVANVYVAMALYLQQQYSKLGSTDDNGASLGPYSLRPTLPIALIAGGETTVSLPSDHGLGGRNQELALAAAVRMHALDMRNVVLASVGTDGTDGPTDAAGGVVDGTTVTGDLKAALAAMNGHDAYPYLAALDAGDMPPPLIKTGPTGTNVADICVTLIQPPTNQ